MIGRRSEPVCGMSLQWWDRKFRQSDSDRAVHVVSVGARIPQSGRLAHTWMVRAVLPTPPSPSTTSLYKVIFPAILSGEMNAG